MSVLTPHQVGAPVDVPSSYQRLSIPIFDTARNSIYFATHSWPSRSICRFDTTSNSFVAGSCASAGFRSYHNAAFDAANSMIYYQDYSSATVCPFSTNNNSFVGSCVPPSSSSVSWFLTAVFDSANNRVYFGGVHLSGTASSKPAVCIWSTVSNSFVGSCVVVGDSVVQAEQEFKSAVFDSLNNVIYFMTRDEVFDSTRFPGRVCKFSTTSNSFIGSCVTLPGAGVDFNTAVLVNNVIYIGTSVGYICRFDIISNSFIDASLSSCVSAPGYQKIESAVHLNGTIYFVLGGNHLPFPPNVCTFDTVSNSLSGCVRALGADQGLDKAILDSAAKVLYVTSYGHDAYDTISRSLVKFTLKESSSSSSTLDAAEIAGIAVGSSLFCILVIIITVYLYCMKKAGFDSEKNVPAVIAAGQEQQAEMQDTKVVNSNIVSGSSAESGSTAILADTTAVTNSTVSVSVVTVSNGENG